MVASNAPRRTRQMMRPVKFFAAAVQQVTMDPLWSAQDLCGDACHSQEIMLNMTQYLTGKTIRAYAETP